MIAYLRLVRLPNVFTALADIIAGYFISAMSFGFDWRWEHFALLCGASACLYLSGMAFNDIADRREDAQFRPGRPIPSGTVSLTGALICALVLMGLGLFLASRVSGASLLCAAILSLAILAYDFVFKGLTLPGPLALGVCRAFNILLGMSAAPEFVEFARSAHVWELPWLPALASGLYGAGVTAFSAQEESGRKMRAIVLGWVFTAAGLIAACQMGWTLQSASPMQSKIAGLLVLGLLALRIALPTRQILREGTPNAARALVLAGVTGYCWLDSGMLLLHGGTNSGLAALCAMAIFLPGKLLRGWLAQREA
jgi:4-hydroxybenzoate polyprenyltransferase